MAAMNAFFFTWPPGGPFSTGSGPALKRWRANCDAEAGTAMASGTVMIRFLG